MKPWTFPGAPDMDMTPVRINISTPQVVLEDLDRKAGARGMTRSAPIPRLHRRMCS